MAKNLTYKRNTTETIKVKGIMNDMGTEITYVDEDKNEQVIEIQQLLNNFCSMPIDLTLKKVEEEELEIPEFESEQEDINLDDLQ